MGGRGLWNAGRLPTGPRSDDREFKPLPVLPPQQRTRRGVVSNRLGRSVVIQHRTGSPGDVRQVAEHGALVIDLDVGIRDRTGPQAIEEVAPVIRVGFPGVNLGHHGILRVVDSPSPPIGQQGSLRAVKLDAKRFSVQSAR